ncbi:MAG: ferritin-like domain-containing protein [Acidobacteriota bacterium]|nr:ferritin-like domain-containing protein [Acidobacteriota bacterium]
MARNRSELLDPSTAIEQSQGIAAGRALNRRSFVAALGMAGAAAGASLMAGCSNETSSVPATTIGSPDVLNFALNLEYLEATFYSFVTTGGDLPATVTRGSGAVTGAPSAITFTGANAAQITDMLNEIYFDELSHVKDLLSLVGSSAIARPALNLAALGPITATNALSVARLFEDVGATAYAGAAALLQGANLSIAAQILAVEGFHAGALRLTAIQNPTIAAYIAADSVDVTTADPGSAALAAAGPTASGAFFATAGTANATSAVPAGLAYTRSTSQVLSIVYGNNAAGTSSGGFFPNGVNGAIRTV